MIAATMSRPERRPSSGGGGAVGAVEAALAVLSLQYDLVPPTANLENADPAFDLNLVTGAAARWRVEAALSNSVSFGGHNVVLAFRTP